MSVALSYAFKHITGLDLFSLSIWAVIPIGAPILGLAAASGYAGAAYWFHIKPMWFDAVALCLVLLVSCFFVFYLDYATFILPDGRHASDLADFTTFTDLSIRASHFKMGRTLNIDAGQVDGFGYVFVATQVIGYFLGGMFSHVITLNLPACNACSLYLRKIRAKNTGAVPGEYADQLMQLCRGTYEDLSRAITWKALPDSFEKGKAKALVDYRLLECPSCKREVVIATPKVATKNGWQSVPELVVRRDLSAGSSLFAEFK